MGGFGAVVGLSGRGFAAALAAAASALHQVVGVHFHARQLIEKEHAFETSNHHSTYLNKSHAR